MIGASKGLARTPHAIPLPLFALPWGEARVERVRGDALVACPGGSHSRRRQTSTGSQGENRLLSPGVALTYRSAQSARTAAASQNTCQMLRLDVARVKRKNPIMHSGVDAKEKGVGEGTRQ